MSESRPEIEWVIELGYAAGDMIRENFYEREKDVRLYNHKPFRRPLVNPSVDIL